jgi:cellobiose transport system substrate-binding protein
MGVITRRRGFAVAALAAAIGLATAGCGTSSNNGSGGNAPKPITLSITIFGDFGYQKSGLYDKYKQLHPNITIREVGANQGLGDENTKLDSVLAAGAGATDVVALEEGTIVKYKNLAQDFVDLKDYGGGSLEGNFLPWKWQEGTTKDGKLLGLGTDVGSMGMCYRSDLFQQAGLPTNRDEVAKLWPTWADYQAQGVKFQNKVKSAKWLDAATNTYNTILMQVAGNNSGYTYFDKQDNLALGQNADIKTAWDTTVSLINAGLSAGLQSFSDAWTAGFKNSKFATIACPAWMLGVIHDNAGPGMSGKWDVTTAPGGAGNWGGSFLAVPTQSKHKAEAADLVKFLTNGDSQLAVFKAVNNLPSNPIVYDNPDFQSFSNSYFSNAPVGKIFGQGAKDLKPVYLGGKNQDVRTAVENALLSVEQKKRTPDQAWADAISKGTAAAKK